MRAVNSESARRLAARPRHRAVAVMDGRFIGCGLRLLRIMRIMRIMRIILNPFSVHIPCDETDATRGRQAYRSAPLE